MQHIEVETLPELLFAHVHQAQQYQNRFEENHEVLEISYVKKGSVRIEKNGGSVLAREGDVICFVRNGETTVRAEEFHCHHTVGAQVKWKSVPEGEGICLPEVLKGCGENEEIYRMIDEFIYHLPLYRTSRIRAASGVLNLLCKIDELARRHTEAVKPEGALLAKRAAEYIHVNLYRPLTQTEIASHLGISPGYLCAVFKKAWGMPVMKYVNREKLKIVESLMEQGHLKLFEAARNLGYEDPNYVSALYKRLFGRNLTDRPNWSKESAKVK